MEKYSLQMQLRSFFIQDVFALEFEGRRFDCGSKEGYISAIIDRASHIDKYKSIIKNRLKAFIKIFRFFPPETAHHLALLSLKILNKVGNLKIFFPIKNFDNPKIFQFKF